MLRKSYLFLFLYLSCLLIEKINTQQSPNQNDENIKENYKIIDDCDYQGYNITDSNDKFFNDICSIYQSKKKKDVTLQYRRKYYYFSTDYKRIILNETLIKDVFPEIKRNNIFTCFKSYLSIKVIGKNLVLLLVNIFFPLQITLFIFILINYTDASRNTPESFFNYIKNNRNSSNEKNNLSEVVVLNNEFDYNDKNNGFTQLQEETNNKNENNGDISIENNNTINKMNIEEHADISLYNNNTDKDNFQPELINNPQNEMNTKSDINISLKKNSDEITFSGNNTDQIKKVLDIDNKSKNEINEKDRKENEQYIYQTINHKSMPKINSNIKKNENIILSSDGLFYLSHTNSIIYDKRTFIQIYFDILSHCQIFFFIKKFFFIYEDKKTTIIYYSIKLNLYIIFNIIQLNSVSIINKIYDNKFTFLESLIRCLIVTILVNVFSQILFVFTNSKKTFIKHITKIKSSLHKNSALLNYSIKEIIYLINNNLFGKLMILFILNILIYLYSFYYSLCFCSTYFYTQFIVLINIIICIIISQIFPFILALIPAYLRRISLKNGKNDTKSERLYSLSKIINLLFLP